MKTLVLFDFDGTITSKDSMLDFVSFSFGKKRLYIVLIKLTYEIILSKLFKKDPSKLKTDFLRLSLKNISQNEFKKYGKIYISERIDQIVLPRAIETLKWHKSKNHRVIIVSASIKEWLSPFAEKYNLELLCTEYDCEKKQLATKNCMNSEKVNRVNELLTLENYNEIYVYGDSSGDKEMLQIATKPFFREFN